MYLIVFLNTKARKKIDHDDFKVLNYNDYDNLLKINYNVKQLKEICRNYKLKISGTKHELLLVDI